MKENEYLNADNWLGSYYELSIEVSSRADDDKLLRAIRRLWASPLLEGPWRSKSDFGHKFAISVKDINSEKLYGLIHLGEEISLGFIVFIIREEAGSDWLDISIPTGMLEKVFPVDYPLTYVSNPWLQKIDDIFVALAGWLYSDIKFDFGIIGEEASGYLSANTATPELIRNGGFLLSEFLWTRLAQPKALTQDSGLKYLPPIGMINITYDNR